MTSPALSPVTSSLAPSPSFALYFQSLFHEGRGLAFPCDAKGEVDIDELSERARTNYLYARAVIGREYAVPAVVANTLH